MKILFIAPLWITVSLFSPSAAGSEITFSETIRGSYISPMNSTAMAEARAKVAARESYEKRCEAWKSETRVRLGKNLVYVSCGACVERVGQAGKPKIFVKTEKNYTSLTTRMHVAQSEGVVVAAIPQKVSSLNDTIQGRTVPLSAKTYDPTLGFKEVAEGVIEADKSHFDACQSWKKQTAADMGARFVFASCEMKPLGRTDAIKETDDSMRFESTSTVYYLAE